MSIEREELIRSFADTVDRGLKDYQVDLAKRCVLTSAHISQRYQLIRFYQLITENEVHPTDHTH